MWKYNLFKNDQLVEHSWKVISMLFQYGMLPIKNILLNSYKILLLSTMISLIQWEENNLIFWFAWDFSRDYPDLHTYWEKIIVFIVKMKSNWGPLLCLCEQRSGKASSSKFVGFFVSHSSADWDASCWCLSISLPHQPSIKSFTWEHLN